LRTIKVNACIPKQDFIVVLPDPVEVKDQSEGGLYLPDSAKDSGVKRTGRVIFCGPDVKRTKPNERIIFSAFAGAGTQIELNGEVYEMMRDSAVLAEIS